ncbi:MAG: hypothetical protein JKY56_09695, partial [Kofleriaceae bacterium]|nr:hypothetical protein [Kofleriaceae bacterium]
MKVRAPAILLAFLLPLLLLVSGGRAIAQEEGAKPSISVLPYVETEVLGTCHTPRQAYLQILYWAKKDARKAALCFDTSGLDSPSSEAPDLAERMLEFLDADDRYIETDKAPIDPKFIDSRSGTHEYYDPLAPEFRIRRAANGRWLFTQRVCAES